MMQKKIEAAAPAATMWETALADYQAKRSHADAMPVGTDGEDEALEAYVQAMDYLIEQVPAQTLEQLHLKIDLARARSDGFEDLLFDDHAKGIVADVFRLCGRSAGEIFAHVFGLNGTCRAGVMAAGRGPSQVPAETLSEIDPDAEFWRAHATWRVMLDAWKADPDKADETSNAWFEREHPAWCAMMLIPVSSADAILAKWQSLDGEDMELPAPDGSALAVIGRDLERLAKLEPRGPG